MPGGSPTHTKNPPFGVFQVQAAGMKSCSACIIASRRSRYISRICLIWPCQSCVERYAETAIWLNAGGHSVADSWASTSFSRTACGASAQPTRMPGEKVLENEPR